MFHGKGREGELTTMFVDVRDGAIVGHGTPVLPVEA